MINEMICAECEKLFQPLEEDLSPIKKCPKCVEEIQERMLNAIFGENWGN